MKTVAVRNISRASPTVIERLQNLGVATVHEAIGRFGLMRPNIRPIYAGAEIAGSAVTVLVQPGDNFMIHVAIELCHPGDILVVGVTTDNTDGMFGELLGTSLRTRGARGLVIDAGCRDVKALTKMSFPVWSKAISARGTVKATLGAVNVPIVCGGEAVRPGDVVVADDDGVVIVPRLQAEAAAAAGEARVVKEKTSLQRLAAGELSLDMSGMRPRLKELGLTYVDNLEDIT